MDSHDKAVWPASYVSSPAIPEWFSRGLTLHGGYNIFAQPNQIVVWGMDAREFCNGDPQAIKYMNPNDDSLGWACFYLERWASPDFYIKEEWDRMRYGPCGNGTDAVIDFLGPFPSRGRYIGVAPLMTEDHKPMELSQQLLDEIKRRTAPGYQKSQMLADMELSRRRKKAQARAVVQDQLAQLRDEINGQRGDDINKLSTQHTVLPMGKIESKIQIIDPLKLKQSGGQLILQR